MTHRRIQPLSPTVANQIAAGEVIVRPASVVKELLENALDAGADTISIDIGFGGLNQIKISDNGIGIVAADLPLAIMAHATSKIKQLDDLYAITSMGFRGEALASIAAISRLSLSSKPDDQTHAMMLHVDGSSTPKVSPCARARGTTIDVRDLFFNAPVRKKFLKTARSEYLAIEHVVKRFALSAPMLALTLTHDGKQIMALPAATCEKTRALRIRKLLGSLFMDQAIPLDVEQAGIRLQGWLSGPTYQRSQNDKQWVYVNQRMMKDKLINHAIKRAYETLLHPGRYPACLLYLSIAGDEVDVNVHPTKHEVRFQQPRLVHDFITSHMSEALTTFKKDMACQYEPLTPPSTESYRPASVHEVYIKQPMQAMTRANATVNRDWLLLNQDVGIVFLHEQPFLIDMAVAQQQWLLSILNQQQFPLASRPLLVPIRYTLANLDCPLIEHCQAAFTQLGIQIDWLGSTEVVVRTLPMLCPQLDIKKLLQRLKGSVIPLSLDMELFQLLVTSQSFNAYQLTNEDKTLLADYLRQHVLTSNLPMPWCLRLDAEKCRELLGRMSHEPAH